MRAERTDIRFRAVDDRGEPHDLVAHWVTLLDDSTDPPSLARRFVRSITTAEGQNVVHLARGWYQLAEAGLIVTSNDPDQPPWSA